MAENIKLATFDFDVTRLENSLNGLQDTMFKLKKESQSYTELMKEQQKAANDLTKQQLALAASGQAESDAFKENEAALADLNTAMAQNFKNQQNVATQQARVRQEITATTNQLKAYMTAEGQQTTLVEAGNKALATQVSNINQARASNTELLRVRNQLNPSIKAENDLITKLNAKMNENNAFIKDNASEYEKQKINIGNYSESVKQAITELGGLNGTLGNAKQALDILTPAFAGLKTQAQEAFTQLKGGTIATEGMTKAQIASATATNVVSGALKLFRVALISTGIGAIVVALGALVSYLTTTQAGIDKVTAVLEPLKAIFSAIMRVVTDLGGRLVEAFSNPKKLLTDLVDFIKTNVMNRITALKDILQGIIELDFDKVGESFVQAATGVDNLVGKVRTAGAATVKFLEDAAAKGREIDQLNKDIARQQLEYNKSQIAVNDALDEQNLIVKNTALSFTERARAANEIIAITAKNSEQEQEIIKLQLRKLQIQQELKGVQNLTNEDRQEEIDLMVKLDEAEDRALNARLENSRVLAGLEKERREQAKKAAEDRLKRIKEEQDAAIKAMQVELDTYLENQGQRKKSLQEGIEVEREVMRQSLEINKAEFEAKKKTRQEYELEVLRIQNEFINRQQEMMLENAEIEFEMLMLNNQRRIEQGQLLNDNLYQQEIDRINRLTEEAQAIETLRYKQGLINLQEYQLAIAELDAADYEAKQAVQLEREEAEKEKQAIDLANAAEVNSQNFFASLEIEQQQLDIRRKQELADAEKTGADKLLINQKYDKYDRDLEKQKNEYKVDAAISTLGALASIAGKESAAGKALAVAQTTIETYKSATSAYSSLSGIPIVGPVLGAIAAAAAVAAGLANVKKILSTKEPKVDTNVRKPSYATGVIGIQGRGSGTSDNIEANLSANESVITARATSMFPNTLSAINQAGGGVGIDGQLASTITQNNITDRVDNTQMSEMIAEAVAVGAERGTERGSQNGIIGLSDNRQIMRDAKF